MQMLRLYNMIREYIFFKVGKKKNTLRPYLLCLGCELRPNPRHPSAPQAEMGRSVTQLRIWVALALLSSLGCPVSRVHGAPNSQL